MEFIREVVDAVGYKMSDKSDKAYKKTAIQLGLIDKKTFSSTRQKINLQDAASIIAKAHEYLYGVGKKTVVVEKYPVTIYKLDHLGGKASDFFKSVRNGDLDTPFDQYSLDDYLFFDADGNIVKNASSLLPFYRYVDELPGKEIYEENQIFIGKYTNFYISAYLSYEYGTKEVEFVSEEDVAYILNKRISDSYEISEKNKEWFAKAYAYGYIAGKSEGDFTSSRIFTPNKKPKATTLRSMIAKLNKSSERYRLTPDWQMCRISQTNRPVMEELYEFILDSYPNMYYDSCFYGMTSNRGAKAMEPPLFSDFFYYVEKLPDRLTNSYFDKGGQFVFPSELRSVLNETDAMMYGAGYGYKSYYPTGSEYYVRRLNCTDEFIDQIEEYYMHALNVDYRTIDKDAEWQSIMRKYVSSDKLEAYIESCKKNKTIIECDKVAADYSSAYISGYKPLDCKVYCHFKIVSDEGIKNKDMESNDFLIPPCNKWSSSDSEGTDARRCLLYSLDIDLGEWKECIFLASGSMTKKSDSVQLVQTFISAVAMRNLTDRYTELVGNEEGLLKYYIK